MKLEFNLKGTTMLSHHEEEVLFTEIPGTGGNVGVITLNRPKVLNALTLDMCQAMEEKLAEWEQSDEIKAVVICGEGERSFCAGGDIRFVYQQGRSGIKKSRRFFWHEYRLNRRIFRFSKPYIALMHGITMGGGAGISVHGTHRVAAEDFVFAMPETGIGFFPDVGGSYILPRCTGKIGVYMALSGDRLNIADAIYSGIVDHLVPKKNFEPLIYAIADSRFQSENVNMQISDLINTFSLDIDGMDIAKPHLLEHRTEINQCFGFLTMESTMEALKHLRSAWGDAVIKNLQCKSPTSLKVTLRQLHYGARMDFDDCMRMEYRIALRFLLEHDFYEGIRAAIVDKDQQPKWHPHRIHEVTDEFVDSFFEPLNEAEELSFNKQQKSQPV